MRRGLVLVIAGIACLSLSGQTSLKDYDKILTGAGFEENWEAREEYKEVIMAPFSSVLHAPTSYIDQVISQKAVKFEMRRGEMEYYLLFLNERNDDFSTRGRGNWIIKKDMRTGDFVQAKIFLQNDADTFIRLFPGQGRSYMDIYLYGYKIYGGIPVSVAFEELILTSFSRILALTENTVDWQYIFTDRTYEEWELLGELSGQLQAGTALLDYVDDGAMNQKGEWVYIESGLPQTEPVPGVNCSGFLKWVADGFYRAAPFGEGTLLTIDELERPPAMGARRESSWSENFDYRDPFFGLDWTRNITSILKQSFTNLETGYYQMDVNRVPFYDYKEEVGYPVEELDTILYLLAVNSPGRIYWGAVSAPYRPEGENVTLWQYYHTLLLVPRFTEEGDFVCDVFQSGDWTTLDIFLPSYEGSWIHLSSSDGLRTFSPPSLR